MSSFKKMSSLIMAITVICNVKVSVLAEKVDKQKVNRIEVERIGGKDRIETSLMISKKLNTNKANIVNAWNFADALSIAPIAAIKGEGIILTDDKDELENSLNKLKIKRVRVLGGEEVISSKIYDSINKKYNARRVFGKDRYETSLNIVRNSGYSRVGIANGEKLHDSLTAGPFLAKKKLPLLLIHKENKKEIPNDLKVEYTFGGEKSIRETFGKRLAGEDRFKTSVNIAQEFGEIDNVILVNGYKYPDALSVAPLAKKMNAPIVLTKNNKLSKEVEEIIKKVSKVTIIGGENSVSDNIEKKIKQFSKKENNSYEDEGLDEKIDLKDDTPLENGDFYGTADSGVYYSYSTIRKYKSGPSVVKINVKDGKITRAESVRYTDDDVTSGFSFAQYAEKKDKLLSMMAGLDIKGVKRADLLVRANSGQKEEYDVISGATITSKGHMSAVIAALKNSAQAYKDKISGKIVNQKPVVIWMEPINLLKSPLYFGKPINMKDVGVILHYSNGKQEKVLYPSFSEFGISCNYSNNQILNENDPNLDKNNNISIEFREKTANSHISYSVQFSKYKHMRFATKGQIEYENGEIETFEMFNNEFRYRFKPKHIVKKISIFENDKLLGEGKYNEEYKEYIITVPNSLLDEYWRFETYFIKPEL